MLLFPCYHPVMPTIIPLQIRHIAKLARLWLSDEEVGTYTKELTSILGYVDILKEIDTKGVEPMTQVTNVSHILRDDVVRPSKTSSDALLSCSPLPLVQHQIQTPAAHG